MLRETVRLHMNEMPYPPAQNVIEAARKGLSKLNRYADPEDLERLCGLLADYSGVSRRHIILSPGSDFLLREVIHTFSKGRRVVMVSPSFFPTVQAAKQFATEQLSIRLSPPTFDLNLELLLKALKGPCLVIMDNPNNPTGRMLLDRRAVEAIAGHRETLLVIDEAYYEFSGMTFADMVADHPRLAIIRTMDKASLQLGGRSRWLCYRRRGFLGCGLVILRLSAPIQSLCGDGSVETARLYERERAPGHRGKRAAMADVGRIGRSRPSE